MCYTAKFLSLVALTAAHLTLAPLVAQAGTGPADFTSYQTSSGATQVVLDFKSSTNAGHIEYKTQIQGKTWFGESTTKTMTQQNGKVTVYGTFRDGPSAAFFSQDAPVFCTGDVVSVRSFTNNRFQLDVSWTVKGGKNCASIGQSFNLKLSEAIPVADAQGDYNYGNSRAWAGLNAGQNDYHTWDRWRVVESGSLNCRERPNGKIVRSYRQGDDVSASYQGRGTASAILGADNAQTNPSAMAPSDIKGQPWLLTTDKCFVRSNSQYIQPLSFSQSFRPNR
jgi:hypothetical protein